MLTPLNLGQFRRWAVKMLYYHLFPYIAEDFMGKQDCRLVHQEGNMLAGETPVTHVVARGGWSVVIDAKKAVYRARAESGVAEVEAAYETGEFTGAT